MTPDTSPDLWTILLVGALAAAVVVEVTKRAWRAHRRRPEPRWEAWAWRALACGVAVAAGLSLDWGALGFWGGLGAGGLTTAAVRGVRARLAGGHEGGP